MRDTELEDVEFIAPSGDTVYVKDIREIPVYSLKESYSPKKEETLDLIAVKIYGDDSEADCYKIHDANVENIVDNDFEIAGIPSLRIPN